MNGSRRLVSAFLGFCFVTLPVNSSFADIGIATLTKEKAKVEYGITMHARKNGSEGIRVWLEFKKEGLLEAFAYADLRMEDPERKHLLSVHLSENPHNHRRPDGVTVVAFSADPSLLERCRFLVGSSGIR